MKDMMMEKHEVKQENKNMEGDPEIKSTRRQLHQELLDEPMKKGDPRFICCHCESNSCGCWYLF